MTREVRWITSFELLKNELIRSARIDKLFWVFAAASIGFATSGIQHWLKPPVADLPSRISTLTASLKGAADTIGQIEEEIKQREGLVQRLEEQADTAKKLSAMNKDQLDAVAQVLRGEIRRDERQNFWNAQVLAFFYAAVGVGLSELYRLVLRWRARRRLLQAE
jgi:hypothetical protein